MKNLIKLPQLFILCLVILSLSSCSDRTHDYEWRWAEKQCENKGGVRYNSTSYGCKCHNGEWITKTENN